MTVSSGLSGIDHQSSLRVFVQHALLFVGCLLFHIAGTWSLPLIDRDEPRFAEASREMIQRSDYVVPYFNNQLRLDKPPLTYWAQTVSYRIFGDNDPDSRAQDWWRSNRLARSDYFHALFADVCACESGRGRHVAGFVCHHGALERTGIAS